MSSFLDLTGLAHFRDKLIDNKLQLINNNDAYSIQRLTSKEDMNKLFSSYGYNLYLEYNGLVLMQLTFHSTNQSIFNGMAHDNNNQTNYIVIITHSDRDFEIELNTTTSALSSDLITLTNLVNNKADLSSIQLLTSALADKVDKVEGKGLSTNDFTNEEKQKLEACLPIRYNTTEYWNNQSGFIPEEGEIIIYSDYKSYVDDNEQTHYVPGIKIGSGNGYVQDLVFTDKGVELQLLEHIQDTNLHLRPGEREFWNNKLNTSESVENETLTFNRL